MGGRKQVFAARDVGDLLAGIIEHDCEVVGGADIASCEDDVAEQ